MTVKIDGTNGIDTAQLRPADGDPVAMTIGADGRPAMPQGISGAANGSSAGAGAIGEAVRAFRAFDNRLNAPGTRIAFDITSINLTAGDWDLDGAVALNVAGATATAFYCSIGAKPGDDLSDWIFGDNSHIGPVVAAGVDSTIVVSGFRVSISVPTVYYLKTQITYTAGTPRVYGRISARRVR